MELIRFIIGLLVAGLVFGPLGRLAVPGPNPMTMGMTILVGIGGAFIGGIVAVVLSAGPFLGFVLQVLGAALIVYLMQRSRRPVG
jgi:uncharacterized membrane protein YeaQ/YmgE (transglycosylase-associated protein family)